MSIPRLELLALLIGMRSLKFVSKELKLESTKITVWTDSQCVLNWIKTKKSLSVFVRNRLIEILSEKSVEFRYINTKKNPADLPSRRLSSNDLKGNSLWWKVPEWLTHNQMLWRTWTNNMANMPKIDEKTFEKIQSEVRGSTPLYEASAIAQETQVFPKTASQAVKTDVTPPFEIKAEQRKHYVDLSKGEMVLNKSIVKSQLNPKIENDGLIRCYGRLKNADLPEETINSILLPTRENIFELLIEGHHKKTFHAGVNHTSTS